MPTLELFSLENILKDLNSCLSRSCGDISFGDSKEMRKVNFSKGVLNSFIELKIKVPLIQSVYGGNLIDVLTSCESDINIGSIVIEKGYENINVPISYEYERLILKVWKPLLLKGNKSPIPGFKINIIRKVQEFSSVEETRQDYFVKWGTPYKKIDLSGIFPINP